MSWITIALASAAVAAVISIGDKTVVHRYAKSPYTLPLLVGIAQTVVGLSTLMLVGLPSSATWEGSGLAALSGALFGIAGILALRVLFTQEVSRTTTITQSAPIFAAILALIVLNEAISLLQWLGVITTVAGTMLISTRPGKNSGKLMFHSSFYVLIVSALFYGAANVTGKAALDQVPLMYTHGIRMLVLGIVFLLFSARRVVLVEVKALFMARSKALVLVSINEFMLANVTLLLVLWALSLGPASLVTAAIGTRAFFVVLYSYVVSVIWKGALGEQISPGAMAIKVVSAIAIVGGVAAIAL